jgi:glycosyltransferase involved in cell wall biosynthesis
MNIGLDAKRAFHNYTGLGNYSRLLIQSMSEQYFDNQYFLFTPEFTTHPLHHFAEKENCKIITPKGINKILPSSLWRSFSVTNDINKQKNDVYHGLSGELPLSTLNIPKVVTIHDLIFMRYPEFYYAFDRKMYENKFRYACKIADIIITISKQTADDCIQFLNADAKKIVIGYQSCDTIFSTSVFDKTISEKYDLPEKYILNIGTIEARKNLLNLVKAMHFIEEDISLVAIGRETSYTSIVEKYIKENNLSHRIILMHSVPFHVFPSIYAAASVFVYPSVFEGFGIPILEALTIGTPTATSNISSMPEVGGDAVLYFNPYNAEEIADRINTLLYDNKIVKELNVNRWKQLEKFSINKIAEKINDIYSLLNIKY